MLLELKKDFKDRDYINAFIKDKQIENCDGLFQIEAEIDLNQDGNKEMVLRTDAFYCGATGNCRTWVVRKRKRYEILFDAGVIEKIEATNRRTNDFRDLQTRYRLGLYDRALTTAKFDGKKYRIKECFAEGENPVDGSRWRVRRKLPYCQ
jgi:hypothetical protein